MFENIRQKISSFIEPKAQHSSRNMVDSPGSLFLGRAIGGGYSPRLGTAELLKSYSLMPWLRASVNKVGQGVGATDWRLFVVRNRQTGEAVRSLKMQRSRNDIRKRLITKELEKGDLEELNEHPVLELLDDGNPRLLGQTVFQLTQQHMDLVGEAFWILERNMLNRPVAIWPIPPDWVKEFPVAGRPAYRVKFGAQTYDIPVTEVIPFIDPDPANPYGRGIGTAKSLGDELETDEYTAKHLKGFFQNRARPEAIISAEGLSRADTRRMEERWSDEFKGFWNSYKTHFINRKIDVHEMSQTFENMQMTELRKFERDIILQVYGFPPEKFGILTASNRSTIIAADLFWTKDVIQPRVELLRSVLQKYLIPMYDDRLILDYDSPMVQDKEHQLAVMRAAPSAFTVNEWRDEADRESLGEEGDIFILRAGEEQRLPVGEDGTFPDPQQENPPPEEQSVVGINPLIAKITPKIKEKAIQAIAEKLSSNTKAE